MISYWGVDHGGEISKAKKDRNGYAVGAGTTVTGLGLVGGGVPGARPDSGRLAHVKAGTKYEATRHLVSGTRGGIFGYREDAHRAFVNRQNSDLRGWRATTRGNHFERGAAQGKVPQEMKVIRHMKNGRVASNVAAGIGAATVAAGLRSRHKQKKAMVSKANRKPDDYKSNALIAGGGTLAAAGGGGSLALDAQGRKWSQRSADSLDAARKMNRKVGGYDVKQTRRRMFRKTPAHTRVPDVVPHRSNGDLRWNNKDVFAGRSNRHATKVGNLRGAATQQRYFAKVYGTTARAARKAGAVGVGVTAAGLGSKYLEIRRKER